MSQNSQNIQNNRRAKGSPLVIPDLIRNSGFPNDSQACHVDKPVGASTHKQKVLQVLQVL